MKKFFSEFKDFILRGNVMDLAVAVIIGGAFQGIVKSLVDDIISPIIGLVIGIDFNAVVWQVTDAVAIRFGAFITTVINFVLLALVIFLLIKAINKITSRGKKEGEPTTKECPYCFSSISIKATRCPHCTAELNAQE